MVIPPTYHLSNLSFCQLAISPTCHFIKQSFHNLVVQPVCSFINRSFHQQVLSPTCFDKQLFQQLVICPTCPFSCLFCQIVIWSNSFNLSFYKLVILQACFANLSLHQIVIMPVCQLTVWPTNHFANSPLCLLDVQSAHQIIQGRHSMYVIARYVRGKRETLSLSLPLGEPTAEDQVILQKQSTVFSKNFQSFKKSLQWSLY